MIFIYNNQKDIIISKKHVKKQVIFIMEKEQVIFDYLSICFVDEKEIKKLHKKYFNKSNITDCISFPIDKPKSKIRPLFLGEVFICPKKAIDYAKKNYKNPFTETSLYLIHSLLHLIGYDDKKKKDRLIMQKKQDILKKDLLKNNFLGICEKHIKELKIS